MTNEIQQDEPLRERNLYGETVEACALRFRGYGATHMVRAAENAAEYFAIRVENRPEEAGLSGFYLRVAAALRSEP